MSDATAVLAGQGPTKGLAPPLAIAKIIKDDFSTHADHIVLKPKKKRLSRSPDLSKASSVDLYQVVGGGFVHDLGVLGEEGRIWLCFIS